MSLAAPLRRWIAAVRARLRELFDSAGDPRFVVSAAAVGVLTGIAAIGLVEAIDLVQRLAIGGDGPPPEILPTLPTWRILLVPTLGGILVGALGAFSREVRGHGVPDVMEAVAIRGGLIRRRVAFVKSIGSAITLGTGGSVGREGPIAHIGASVGSGVGQLLGLASDRLRTLAAAGAAGGIAAAFNAPLAGSFFALEVIARNFATHTFGPVVLCAVAATGVSRLYFGAAPAFAVPPFTLGGPVEAPLAAALGVFCGCLAPAFVAVLGALERGFTRLPAPALVKPALGGLALGAMFCVSPHLFGSGHATLDALLRGELAWPTLALLLVMKPVATSTTLASGGSGGVFLPSLYVGGLAGSLFGAAALALVPGLETSSGAYALVGMAAVLAGTSHAPLTAVLLAFELTQSYAVILPVMMAVALATLVSRALRRNSIYTEVLAARGIDPDRREDLVLRGVRVAEVMDPRPPAVRANAPLDVVLARFLESDLDAVFVTDPGGRLLGQVSIHDVKEGIGEQSALGQLVVARDVCESAATARADDTVGHALDSLVRAGRDVLAVVGEAGGLVGALSLRTITEVIARQALRGEVLGVAAGDWRGTRSREALRLETGIGVRPLTLPARLAEETVQGLDLRRRFGVSVLALRRGGVDEGIDPARPLERGDVLVVMGDTGDLDRFERWLAEDGPDPDAAR
ncbi:MAG TPA: chloride channel protein [Myxococcota bacterium]|nr:chloride channel protein [Myxococcota bacterium]